MTEPVIRLDRSKTFSENHGDMLPDDPLYRVRFWQGGTLVHNGKRHTVLLPFDIEGNLVPDDNHPAFKGKDAEGKEVTYQPLYSPLMKTYLAAKTKKMQALAPVASSEPKIEDEGGDEDDVLGGPSADVEEVNLGAFLRGEVEYRAGLVRDAARTRYGVMKARIADLVVELVIDHKLVPEEQLAPKWKAVIDSHDKQMSQGQAA